MLVAGDAITFAHPNRPVTYSSRPTGGQTWSFVHDQQVEVSDLGEELLTKLDVAAGVNRDYGPLWVPADPVQISWQVVPNSDIRCRVELFG